MLGTSLVLANGRTHCFRETQGTKHVHLMFQFRAINLRSQDILYRHSDSPALNHVYPAFLIIYVEDVCKVKSIQIFNRILLLFTPKVKRIYLDCHRPDHIIVWTGCAFWTRLLLLQQARHNEPCLVGLWSCYPVLQMSAPVGTHLLCLRRIKRSSKSIFRQQAPPVNELE